MITYLVDVDAVLGDFDGLTRIKLHEQYPHIPIILEENQTSFYMSKDYPDEVRGLVYKIQREKGFFRDIPVVPGGPEAINELLHRGNNVFLCTTPIKDSEFCASEKYEWVIEHCGRDWQDRVILARDKTAVRGDFLIDDKPIITGAFEPVWEHIIYTRSYNLHVTNKRRLTWENWRDVLERNT